jgi:hypothetical protein
MNRDFRACLPATATLLFALLPFQSALAGGGRGCPDAPWSASAECGAGERCQASAPHDGNAELMKRLDAKDTSASALAALVKEAGKLELCPLSEAEFVKLPAATQQKIYDRGAAFRDLARSLAATVKAGGADAERAKGVLKRLADDNGRASLSKYAQAQGKFAAELLSK